MIVRAILGTLAGALSLCLFSLSTPRFSATAPGALSTLRVGQGTAPFFECLKDGGTCDECEDDTCVKNGQPVACSYECTLQRAPFYQCEFNFEETCEHFDAFWACSHRITFLGGGCVAGTAFDFRPGCTKDGCDANGDGQPDQ